MNKNPIVVALGGNALKSKDNVLEYSQLQPACAAMAAFSREGLVVTHGNGPQIGALATEASSEKKLSGRLDLLNAETEGLLGYLVEQELANQLDGDTDVSTLLTRVEVDRRDPAFRCPGKPIGKWFTASERKKLSKQSGWQFMERNNKYRRVVPSPKPLRTFQLKAIKTLLDAGNIVICAGGGGIPVCADAKGVMHGIEAVVDKDYSSSLIARELNARLLVLATEADGVYKNWQQSTQQKIALTDPETLEALSLPEGSMGPKVHAACDFVRATRAPAIIGAIKDLPDLLRLQKGTRIEWSHSS